MSFLSGGAECGPTNALSQVLKHSDGDRSLQQDRSAGPSSSRLRQLGPTNGPRVAEHDIQMARQFFEGQNQSFHGPQQSGNAFALPAPYESMPASMSHGSMGFSHSSSQSLNWASEFGASSSAPLIQQQANAPNQHQQSQQHYSQEQTPTMYGGMNRMHMMMGNQGYESQQFAGKGKGKQPVDVATMDAAFTKAFDDLTTVESTARIVEVDQGQEGVEKDLDFEQVWDSLQSSELPPPQEDIAKWEAQFNELMSGEREDDMGYGEMMQNAWEGGTGNYDITGVGEPLKFDEQGLPILDAYVFEKDNRYLDPSSSTRSPLADAKALLQDNGSLSEAALLLEAAIQKGELGEGGHEAWILLGETRNMDEREEAGMRALVEGVKRSESVGAMGAGMLSLAISYTNESYDKASHTMLLRWIRARFPSHHVPQEVIDAVANNSSWASHTKVTDVFISLAQAQYSQGMVDSDLQIGLGVLFYTNGDYDRAKDCFQTALDARPQDYLLWNRLGSCLSNGNKPEEALGAYREALNLRPTYTRAIYNVGVACLNIGAVKESVEHFLSALAMQEQAQGDTSDQLWNTLRRALLAMERVDLADLAEPKLHTNLQEFRKAGFDF